MHFSLMQNENAVQKKACVEMLTRLPSSRIQSRFPYAATPTFNDNSV
jgi:hypothetical protein